MILVGQYDSPFVRRVAIALRYYGVEFERRPLSVFGDFDTMLQINPLGKVPTLELSSGERIFDSKMILDYLDKCLAKGNSLLPSSHLERMSVSRIEAVALGLAEKCYEREVELLRSTVADSSWIGRLERQIASACSWLEAQEPDPWFVGPRMSRADVAVAVAFSYAKTLPFSLVAVDVYPFLEKHSCLCESLSSFQKTRWDSG